MDKITPDRKKRDTVLPEWKRKALEGLSSEDQGVVAALQTAFERRNLNTQWVYEGAGTDTLPLFIAPNGTHIEYIDPYHYDGHDAELREHIQRGPLGEFLNEEGASATRLELPGSTVVEHTAAFGDDVDFSERPIDVLYTNTITRVLSPNVLDNLRVDGAIVIEGGHFPANGLMDHPWDLIPPIHMGIELAQSGITIYNMAPKGFEEVTEYGYEMPKRFMIFEKKRELNEQERMALHVNRIMRKLFDSMRMPIFDKGYLDNDPAKMSGCEKWLREALVRYNKDREKFSAQEEEMFSRMLQVHMSVFFEDALSADIVDNLIVADDRLGDDDFSQVAVDDIEAYIEYMDDYIGMCLQVAREELGISVDW